MKITETLISIIIILVVLFLIGFNIYITIKCWNIPMAEKTGWCAMQYFPTK